MDKLLRNWFFLCMILHSFGSVVFADITWGSQSSAFRVLAGANLNISTTSLEIQGTLEKKTGALLSGNSINFNQGIFASEGTENNFTGALDLDSSQIILQSGDLLRCKPGSIVEGITIIDVDNRIEGQPIFGSDILFETSAAFLTLALQSNLNKNIVLNGGTLTLDDHLWFSDEVMVTGSGFINLNKNQMHFGGTDLSWTGSPFWIGASDINLHSNVALSGIWTFSGDSKINGNQYKLDLSSGGVLYIKDNTTLRLSSINITGILQGSIFFEGQESRIIIDDSTLSLDETITITQGGIYVDGSLSIKSNDHGFIFDQLASLTIDGAILQYFVTVFDQNNQIIPTLIHDPNSTFIILLNDGSIINLAETTAGVAQLVGKLLSGTINLSQNVDLFPRQGIFIGGDTTINGSGTVLTFSNPNGPQITVKRDQTLTLENIVLSRINSKTFALERNAKINIGPNVIWELSEDLVFGAGGIVLTGTSDTFTMRGIGGKRRFTLPYSSSINLGTNTLILESIEFTGQQFVRGSSGIVDDQIIVGALALSGDAIINLTKDTGINFVVEGFGNEFRIAKDNITLTGNLLYADLSSYNELHINAGISGTMDKIMQLNFGANFLSLSSLNGRAQLIFDKPINIYNVAPTSFVLGDHGYLSGTVLGILNNPIKQLSGLVGIDPLLVLTSDQPNAINTSVVRNISRFDLLNDKPTTAFHLQRIKEHGRIPMPSESKITQAYVKPYARETFVSPVLSGEYSRPKPRYSLKRKNKKRPSFQFMMNNAKERSFDFLIDSPKTRSFATRAIQTTTDYDIKYFNAVRLGSASGVILLDGAQATDFNASLTDPLSLTLKNNATVTQGSSDVVINSGNTINIIGAGNKITVVNNFTLEGALRFNPGASLTIEFSELGANPTFIFASSEQILLEPGVVLEFKGRGTIKCSDGTLITLSDTPSDLPKPSFIIKDGAVLNSMLDATTTFSGTGKVSLINNGTINLDLASQIRIGNSDRDNIDVLVHGGNILMDLDETTTIPQANVSFQKGFYSLSVDRGGLIFVGNGGRLEFNAFEGNSSPASIKNISLTPGGNFRIDGSGQVIIGENKRTLAEPGLFGTEIPFAWDSLATNFGGKGFVGFVSQRNGKPEFMGQLQSNANQILLRTSSITAEEMVRTFVQTKPTLLVSTLFIDIDGNNRIRTVTGAQVVLDEHTVVTGDDSDGNIFLLNTQTGQASTLNSAGQ